MKKILLKSLAGLGLAAFVSTNSFAQFSSMLFFDKYNYRAHNINPANQYYGKGFFELPLVFNMYAELGNSNLAVRDLFETQDGKTMFFFNKNSKDGIDRYLKSMKRPERVFSSLKLDIINFGFRVGEKNFVTVESSLRTDIAASASKELLRLPFDGMSDGKTYDLKAQHFGVNTSSWIEYSLGFSRQWNENLTVGGKLKYLYGIANVKTKTKKLDVYMNENEWVMSGDAEFYGSLPGLTLIPDEKNPKQLDDIDIDIDDDANFDSFHNGNGFAVDLGATYQLLPEVKLSASLLDFGFIHWNKNVGAVKKVNDWKYTGVEYDFTSDNNGDYFDKYQDSFDEAFEIDDINAYNSFLVPKLNLGGEYSFFEDKLGAGLLSRTFFLPRSVWEELVITANYRPVKRLTLSTGYTITNLRHESICFAANMTGGFFNVYFGIDNIPMFWGKVVDEYGNKKVSIPSRLNYMRINLGIGFALGGHRKDKDKKDKVKDVIEKFDTTPIVTDSDFDGVVDSLDRCPQTPEGVAVDANGCPLDADGDKVPDYLDKCPDTPAGATVDENGCPNDSDGDGVLDENDLCPETPAGASVNEHGCSDSDGDGVPDNEDICAGTPSDASVDSKGCPIDTDGDGVPDYLDKCPTVAGPNNGCPEIKEEAKQIFKKALKGIQFASGKSVILTSSYSVLNQVVTLMKNNPEYKLTIKGHTDSSGDPAMNLKLSQERADAVKIYLVAKGIDANRLTAIGYGDKSPVADNSTQAGRAQNRRVELEAEY